MTDSDFLFELEPYGSGDAIMLPVSPETYEINYPQNSETVNVNAIGDINLLGHRGLKSVTLESFFPDQEYGFCVSTPQMSPEEYIHQLADWKNKNQKLYFKAGDTVNFLCTITNLTYSQKDATGDIYFSVELTEYRKLGSNRVVPSGKGNTGKSGKTYKCKKGDTLKKLSKKYYGSSKYATALYQKNKSAIESAFKPYEKAKAKKKAAEWNKKYPSKKRTWEYYYDRRKPKNSENGKYLYGNPKIVIPSIKK